MSGSHPIPTHTPLAALPAVALDLETTGLVVETDRIVEIAILKICEGAEVVKKK